MNTFTDFKINPVNGQVSFTVNDVDISINNAVRRVMLSELPNVAVRFNAGDIEKAPAESDIEFIENTTCLHNEFLGHRISLIPIHIEEDELDNYDPEKYTFVINIHNQTHEVQFVTTKDILVYDNNGQEYPSSVRDKLFPVSPITGDPIYIVALNPNHYNTVYGDKIHVRFKASVGIAKEHARFSPISCCTYFNVIDRQKAEEAKRLLIEKTEEAMKKKEAGRQNMTDEEKETLSRRFDVHDAFRYYVKNEETDEVAAVRFTIESECRLSARYLFAKSLDVLVQKLQKVMKPNRYKITRLGEPDSMQYSILIKGEQHTLGNLLQTLMYNMYVREASDLEFVGYYLPHPLVDEIIMKLRFTQGHDNYKTVDGVRAFFETSIKRMQTMLRDLRNVWIESYDTQMKNVGSLAITSESTSKNTSESTAKSTTESTAKSIAEDISVLSAKKEKEKKTPKKSVVKKSTKKEVKDT